MNKGDCYVLGYKTPNIHDFYMLGHKLGRGELRTTYMCTEIDTGIKYACKSTHKATLLSSEDVEDLKREIEIMQHLADCSVENIVIIKGVYEDASFVHIVVELCLGGNLIDSVSMVRYCDERQVAELVRIIVGVVAACHSHGVMLRDVKLENFMFGKKDHGLSLKAIDFRLAVFFEPGQVYTEVVGSPKYIAPEVLLKHYGPEVDVWSAGVILYTLLSGVAPFGGGTDREIFDAVLRGHIDFNSSGSWLFISDSAKYLIREMLCSRRSQRLTAHKVLGHPWFYQNGVAADTLTDPTPVSSRRMNLEEVIDNSETDGDDDDDEESGAGYPYSDQDGSEYSTTFDEPRRLTYLDQNHNGKSKLFESDDSDEEEEYRPMPPGINPINSLAYENNALRAMNKSLIAENDALLRTANKTLMSENDALRAANKCLASECDAIKDTIKESKEVSKQETMTWFEIGSISLGPYSLDLKNLTLKRETVKK